MYHFLAYYIIYLVTMFIVSSILECELHENRDFFAPMFGTPNIPQWILHVKYRD